MTKPSTNVIMTAAAAAKWLQPCPNRCNPIDGSPPGSPVPGILQARTLEWVAISFSNAWKWKVKVKSLSHVWLLATPWTAAHQAPPCMGFSRQEYWSGVPSPSPCLHTGYWFLPFSKSCSVDNKTIHPMRSEEFEVGNDGITTVLHEGHSGTSVKKAWLPGRTTGDKGNSGWNNTLTRALKERSSRLDQQNLVTDELKMINW